MFGSKALTLPDISRSMVKYFFMTPEGTIKSAIREYLDTIPDLCVLPVATTGMWDPVRKRFRKSTMRLGTPDILCCYKGLFIAIEVKSEQGRLSESQRQIKEEIERCWGLYMVARSVPDVREGLKSLLSRNIGHNDKHRNDDYR